MLYVQIPVVGILRLNRNTIKKAPFGTSLLIIVHFKEPGIELLIRFNPILLL